MAESRFRRGMLSTALSRRSLETTATSERKLVQAMQEIWDGSELRGKNDNGNKKRATKVRRKSKNSPPVRTLKKMEENCASVANMGRETLRHETDGSTPRFWVGKLKRTKVVSPVQKLEENYASVERKRKSLQGEVNGLAEHFRDWKLRDRCFRAWKKRTCCMRVVQLNLDAWKGLVVSLRWHRRALLSSAFHNWKIAMANRKLLGQYFAKLKRGHTKLKACSYRSRMARVFSHWQDHYCAMRMKRLTAEYLYQLKVDAILEGTWSCLRRNVQFEKLVRLQRRRKLKNCFDAIHCNCDYSKETARSFRDLVQNYQYCHEIFLKKRKQRRAISNVFLRCYLKCWRTNIEQILLVLGWNRLRVNAERLQWIDFGTLCRARQMFCLWKEHIKAFKAFQSLAQRKRLAAWIQSLKLGGAAWYHQVKVSGVVMGHWRRFLAHKRAKNGALVRATSFHALSLRRRGFDTLRAFAKEGTLVQMKVQALNRHLLTKWFRRFKARVSGTREARHRVLRMCFEAWKKELDLARIGQLVSHQSNLHLVQRKWTVWRESTRVQLIGYQIALRTTNRKLHEYLVRWHDAFRASKSMRIKQAGLLWKSFSHWILYTTMRRKSHHAWVCLSKNLRKRLFCQVLQVGSIQFREAWDRDELKSYFKRWHVVTNGNRGLKRQYWKQWQLHVFQRTEQRIKGACACFKLVSRYSVIPCFLLWKQSTIEPLQRFRKRRESDIKRKCFHSMIRLVHIKHKSKRRVIRLKRHVTQELCHVARIEGIASRHYFNNLLGKCLFAWRRAVTISTDERVWVDELHDQTMKNFFLSYVTTPHGVLFGQDVVLFMTEYGLFTNNFSVLDYINLSETSNVSMKVKAAWVLTQPVDFDSFSQILQECITRYTFPDWLGGRRKPKNLDPFDAVLNHHILPLANARYSQSNSVRRGEQVPHQLLNPEFLENLGQFHDDLRDLFKVAVLAEDHRAKAKKLKLNPAWRLSESKALQFAKIYQLTPDLISKGKLSKFYRRVCPDRQFLGDMNFPMFVEWLGRIALYVADQDDILHGQQQVFSKLGFCHELEYASTNMFSSDGSFSPLIFDDSKIGMGNENFSRDHFRSMSPEKVETGNVLMDKCMNIKEETVGCELKLLDNGNVQVCWKDDENASIDNCS